jgi:hypothetical protein
MEFQLSCGTTEKNSDCEVQVQIQCKNKLCLNPQAQSCLKDKFVAKMRLSFNEEERVATLSDWWTDDVCDGEGALWLNPKLQGMYSAMLCGIMSEAVKATELTPDDYVMLQPHVRDGDDPAIVGNFYTSHGWKMNEKLGVMRAKVSDLLDVCEKNPMSAELQNWLESLL